MDTDPKIYGIIIAEWYDDHKYTRLKMYNCTKQEALGRAIFFWLRKAQMVSVLEAI